MGMMINRRRVYGGKSMPYDAEIEYLEANGTQYIDTLYYPNTNTKIVAKGMYTHQGVVDSWHHMHFLYGTRETIGGGQLNVDYLWNYYSGTYDNACNFGKFIAGEYFKNDYRNRVVTIINDKNGGWIDGEKIFSLRDSTEFQFNYSLYLLWCNINGVGQKARPPYGRIYYCQIYENDVLIHHYVPVRIGTTGYMYDKVSGQLFGNAGTGAFILGPDV